MAIHWPSFILLLLALGCVFELVQALHLTASSRRANNSRGRLRSLAADLQDPETDSFEASLVRDRMASGRVLDVVLGHLPSYRAIELLLYRAGWTIGAARFLCICAAFSLVAGGVTLRATLDWPPAVGAAVAGALLPLLFARSRKAKRMRLFEEQLPEALELVCRALRAGHALSAGIRMVADELDDPLSSEFAQVADEVALGMETREALANLCHRIDVPDLGFFSTAVLIQRETGGNLADVMERIGYVIRERHKFYGKVRSMTAQNRGAAMVLLLTPPVFLLLMNRASPGFVEPLWTTPQGTMLAWFAGGLTVFGYAIARRLAVIKA